MIKIKRQNSGGKGGTKYQMACFGEKQKYQKNNKADRLPSINYINMSFLFIHKLQSYFHSCMLVLFVNLYKPDQEGQLRFKKYYDAVSKVLHATLYFGTNYQEIIRNKQHIDDFLYDEFDLVNREREHQKFKSVEYVFIEGPLNIPPWSASTNKVLLLIRNCLKQNKKLFLSGFGHMAGYYYLTTKFDKQYCIKGMKEVNNKTGKQDYFHDEDSGDLYNFGKKVCNSGIKILRQSGRCYGSKSAQALKKGLILPSKSHLMAFGTRNGHCLLNNINLPFTFYQNSKVFCTALSSSKAKVQVLVQTEQKNPLVYLYNSVLSCYVICPETLKIFANWIKSDKVVNQSSDVDFTASTFDELGFQNTANRIKLASNTIETSKIDTLDIKSKFHTIQASRPRTACTTKTMGNKSIFTAKSKFLDFDKPSLRCSGPYATLLDRYMQEEKEKKPKFIGRSRLIFKSEMQKNEVETYVQRTPSRPPSSHNFREINKSKWLDKKTFFVT